jgi:serine protease inhibitor
VATIGSDSNMVASLFGISAAMAMVYAGARENTSVQMKSVLSYPKNDLVLHEGYKDMMNVLQANKIFTFEAANRRFVHKKTKLLEAYTTLLWRSTITPFQKQWTLVRVRRPEVSLTPGWRSKPKIK